LQWSRIVTNIALKAIALDRKNQASQQGCQAGQSSQEVIKIRPCLI